MNDEVYANLMIELTEKIFKKNYNHMLSVKEDMTSEAYLNLWKAKDKYQDNKSKINTYMTRIIHNTFRKYIRDNIYKHQDKFIDKTILTEGEFEEISLEDIIGKNDINYNNIEYYELIKKFDRNIEERNKHTSRKINLKELHYIMKKCNEGYSQTEIANMLGVSQNTIKKKIHKIRDIILEIKNN